jgi:hypothetical protein
MVLPLLYKYLDVNGAKLTLGNGRFRHADPSEFHDIEEMTVQSIFPDEIEVALKKLSGGLTDVILAHLNDPPTCPSPQREMIMLIQHAYRTNPGAAEIVKAEVLKKESSEPLFNVEYMRKRAEQHVKEINELMRAWRILLTTNKDSERMWSEYAESHKGVVLRVEPNVAKDSKFQLFRPVVYRETRPPVYDDTMEFLASSLFGDLQARVRSIMEKIVYAKTLKWRHESEYRLAIPLGQNELPYNTPPYHPEEITEIYLGLAMEAADRDEIVARAMAVNPDIAIFKTNRDAKGAIAFDRT